MASTGSTKTPTHLKGEPAEESEDELFMGFASEPGAYDITPDGAPRFLRFEWLPDDTVLATGIDDADRVRCISST